MDPWQAFLNTLSSKEAAECAEEIAVKAGTYDGSWEVFRAAAELLAQARGIVSPANAVHVEFRRG